MLGHHAQELSPALPDWCQSCVQDFTLGLGTAKAVMAALPMIEADTRVLITSGDKPCISQESYQHLLDAVDGTTYCAAVLYADRRDPEGYDRVIFDGDGDVKRIAHSAELLPPEEDIPSVNACVYCFSGKALIRRSRICAPMHSGFTTSAILSRPAGGSWTTNCGCSGRAAGRTTEADRQSS